MSPLEDIVAQVRRANADGGLAGFAIGFPRLDLAVWEYGRGRLRDLGIQRTTSDDGPDVYLATQLYRDGGHTPVIGDFVRARAARAKGAHLIVTNSAQDPTPLTDEIRDRTGLAADAVTELRSGTLEERFIAVVSKLVELRPSRLFLFHHPDDPLAVAAAHPALSGQSFLVHHSDATPSLGLHIPGAVLIELNPFAAAMARVQRLDASLLLLTCPDPGPRPRDFLKGGPLVTASSGAQWKFQGTMPCSYARAVTAVLRATGGRHVHIGPLDETTLASIRSELAMNGIDPEAFIHREWVASLAMTLRELGCDVFLASFPTDGARTLIEVAASGTPYLSHAARRPSGGRTFALGLPGAASWSGLEDLADVMKVLMDRETLAAQSQSARDWYLRLHHPTVFAHTLDNIISGRGGVEDPDGAARDFAALARITRRLAENSLIEWRVSPEDIAAVEVRLASAIDALAAKVNDIDAKMASRAIEVPPPRAPPMVRAWRMFPAGLRRRVRALIRPT